MKREEIKAIFAEATDEQLKAVLDLNGADVEKAKQKAVTLENDLKERKKAYEALTSELEALKASNASAEDWKVKFEALQAENEAKAKQAEADRIAKEKADSITNRFNAAKGDKKFNHTAVEQYYIRLFGEALTGKDYEGKSDADIFHDLTKDDATAFEGVTAVRLPGGTNKGVGTAKQYSSKDEIMAIKDSAERLSAIQANPNLFTKG